MKHLVIADAPLAPIPGHTNYFINRHGLVWSALSSKFLKLQFDKRGYPTVKLANKNKTVHRLMAKTYLSEYCDSLQVNHINGVKTDNRLENLEMCTNDENMKHAYKEGIRLNKSGEHASNAKLSASDVQTIRELLINTTHKEIAKKFGVDRTTITAINRGKNWTK